MSPFPSLTASPTHKIKTFRLVAIEFCNLLSHMPYVVDGVNVMDQVNLSLFLICLISFFFIIARLHFETDPLNSIRICRQGERDRDRDRQTYRWRERGRDRQIVRDIERQLQRQQLSLG